MFLHILFLSVLVQTSYQQKSIHGSRRDTSASVEAGSGMTSPTAALTDPTQPSVPPTPPANVIGTSQAVAASGTESSTAATIANPTTSISFFHPETTSASDVQQGHGKFEGNLDLQRTDTTYFNLTGTYIPEWECDFDTCQLFVVPNFPGLGRMPLDGLDISPIQHACRKNQNFTWNIAERNPVNATVASGTLFRLVIVPLVAKGWDTSQRQATYSQDPDLSKYVKSHDFTFEGSMNSVNTTIISSPPPEETAASQSMPAQAAAQNADPGIKTSTKIGLGVGLGLGIPLILAAAVGLVFALRRRKSSIVNDPYSRQPLDPSAEDVVATGYNKGFDDHSPPLPPIPSSTANGVVAAGTIAGATAGARESHQLQPLDTAMPTPATGIDASPVSPLSRRSSVSSISTMGQRTNPRTSTMVSEHH